MRILLGADRTFLPRNLRYLSSKNVSYKETLNMPKSKFASTMKNRVKCENDIRKVGKSIEILLANNFVFRNILSMIYGPGKRNKFVVHYSFFTMDLHLPMGLFTSDIFSIKSDIIILQMTNISSSVILDSKGYYYSV